MSKSSAATAPKIPSSSAWLRGPPQSSSSTPTPRSQSPAPSNSTPPTSASHSRRPSTLGQQAVSFKDGVGARSPVNTSKPGSSVTFGSIDDVSAPISSSPASVPPIKSEGIKSFGSLAASTPPPNTAINGKPPTPSSAPSVTAKTSTTSSSAAPHPKQISKMDIRKLFQSPSTPSAPSSQPPADTASPSSRPSQLPHTSPPSQQSHQQPAHHQQQPHFGSFQPSYPPHGSGLRPQQQNGASGSGRPPPSPVYPRQVPNGTPSGINVNGRPTGPPTGPPTATTPMSANMPSPRLGAMPGQPPPMQPGQVPVAYPPYYYGYVHPDYMYSPTWPMQHVMPPQQPPQGPPGPHPGMSPRNPPQQLHPPGTPTLSPAPVISAPGHPPHSTPSPHMHTSPLSNVTSPPPTPSVSTGPRAPTMDRNAPPFIPGGRAAKVVIKNDAGDEVHFGSFKRQSGAYAPPSPIVAPGSPARRAPIRIESVEEKNKRIAESEERERAKKAAEDKLRREAEERERKKKEEVEKKKREAEEKERVKKEAEAERLRKEAEQREKERIKEKEEEERKERLRKEEEERIRKAEEDERLRKEAEEQERLKKEAEEKERVRIEEAELKAKAEAEAIAAAAAAAASVKPETIHEQAEEGEVEDDATPKDELKDKISEKASLRIDTAVHPDASTRRRPGPLDLTSTRSQPIAAPLPSALATARIIDDLERVPYPEGIQSPKPELNVNAKQGKFRYDRDFLLQFMAICKERPDSLPPLDAIGLEPSEQSYAIARGGSGRRPQSGMGPPASRQASIGLGFKVNSSTSSFNMGQFSTPGNKATSDDRFGMSSRSASMSGGPPGFPLGRPSPMVRSSSQGGPGGPPSHRTRSKRGEKRGDPNKGPGPGQSSYNNATQMAALGLEPVAPLEASVNRWVAGSTSRKPPTVDPNSPEIVDRKVKGLLNKLTMEKFVSISDQIIEWANKSESEKDGRTLIQVIRLVFEKATDEASWSEMYARLCRKMMERISPKVQDDSIRGSEGKPIAGGQLFRKYLLNRCQEDFERGWVAKEATAAAAATKSSEDKAAAENNKDGESALYSDEYYAAQKAKRQGLGLVKFIGELFKLQMLTERIMHECVKKLLSNVDNPEEEEIESLCKLLTTVGQLLDTPRAEAHMDVYFTRMKELTRSPNVNSRMQFMLQDVIELRHRKWIPRNQVAAPTTLAAVHEAAAKDRAANEKESHRNLSMSRGGSRRGGDRGDHNQPGPDGWVTPAARPPPKVGDLSNFGKISKTNSMTFGPASVFSAKEKGKRDSTITRTNSNMFSMLNEVAAEVTLPTKSSRPPSRKPSVDLGTSGVPSEPPQRRKIQLLPRSKPVESKPDDSAVASTESDEEPPEQATTSSMTVEEAHKRIEEDSKEFFNVRDLNEAEVYFTKLPVEHRRLLIEKLINAALDSNQSDADLVAGLFARAAASNWCSPATFEEGFMPVAEIIDDIVIDVPKAFVLFATIVKGAGLDKDEARRTRLASKSAESDKLLALLS